jgi:hypothetical protein
VLVESVLLNTPVISTDVGVAKELIEKYGCGDLVDYDEKELACTMIQYMNKYDGYKNIFDIGQDYDIMTEVKKTEELIDVTVGNDKKNSKIKRLNYPEITIYEEELERHDIKFDSPYVLRVIKNHVPYEYLINRKSKSDKLIVFNNGAVAEGNVTMPVFQRHSWMNILKTSSIFCMDPTLYLNGILKIGWGIGRNDDYYLENSSLILKKIVSKMGITLENAAIYGTSAGGYISIIMGIYLKGAKVVADNAQLDVRNWIFKDALDAAITFCFDNIGDALCYKERFSIADAFELHNYVPKIYMHVNICSKPDNSTQLLPFLVSAEKMKNIEEYNDIEVILHYEPEKGHDGINMDDAIKFLYSVLDII